MKRLEDTRFAKPCADAELVAVRPEEGANARESDANVLACEFAE